VNQQLAYEIGAVFLLAAMLMWGSSARFFPNFRLGPGTLAAAGIALSVFAVFRYGGEVWSSFAPSASAAAPATAASVPARISTPLPVKPAAPPPHWKTVVVDQALADREAIPVAAAAAPAPAPEPKPLAAPVASQLSEAPPAGPCETSPYQSKIKRALKAAGCATHILPRK